MLFVLFESQIVTQSVAYTEICKGESHNKVAKTAKKVHKYSKITTDVLILKFLQMLILVLSVDSNSLTTSYTEAGHVSYSHVRKIICSVFF